MRIRTQLLESHLPLSHWASPVGHTHAVLNTSQGTAQEEDRSPRVDHQNGRVERTLRPERDKLRETGLASAESRQEKGLGKYLEICQSTLLEAGGQNWILHHLSSSLEVIWVLVTHSELSQSTGSLGCLSRAPHQTPEPCYLLGSEKRKMRQSSVCCEHQRMACRPQANSNANANANILYGLPRHSTNDRMTHSRKLSNCQPKDMPHALPPSLGRAEAGVWLAGRQAAGKAEQAGGCGYLLCFWTELSGSRRG